jgi:hypothetical protein
MAILVNNPLLARLISMVLGAVDPLVIITHLVLLDLKYPANLYSFFLTLFPLITLDMFPTDEVY